MGLLMRRRRPLLRLAATAGVVDHAPKTCPEAGAAIGYVHVFERDPVPTTTSADRAAALMRGLVASVTGDSSVVAELYTDDVSGWSPSTSVSSAVELAIELEDTDDTFSDIELTFAPLDVGGDKACVEWELRATHTGPLVIDDDVQIDATGIRLTLHGVTVAEFDGDRIRGFRQYWDDAELLAQVGALPDD
ncbi:MAG: ester cyclase [Acidimicrobiia bacterium]